ncbi:hypothetical protein JZO77_04520 [Enterococcus hulanensis]|uniref:hypothetical protein n=1 Tax=Enterococcus hulanensis TaxID=2559929 RepID=UPI001A8D7592|nr:hypothetical protein [Enterococcus hulanensis]MBO0456000.1 hypothetical protein [Enterococcus hulanensis]
MLTKIIGYESKGFNKSYSNEEWLVALKNSAPENTREAVNIIECHHETDEIFILLDGKATVVEAVVENSEVKSITEIPMEKGKLHVIPKNVWHTTWMQPHSKLAIIERADTSYDNSDFIDIDSL